MTDAELQSLDEAEKKLEQGSWLAQGEGICCGVYEIRADGKRYPLDFNDPTWADAQFVALARNLMRPLIERLRVAEALLNHMLPEDKETPWGARYIAKGNELLAAWEAAKQSSPMSRGGDVECRA